MKISITFVLIMEKDSISNQQLKDLSDKLKTHYPNWVTLVAEGISKEKDWKEWSNNPCTADNARNISNGIIKGQMHRLLFSKVAARLILAKVQEGKEVTELVNNAIQ